MSLPISFQLFLLRLHFLLLRLHFLLRSGLFLGDHTSYFHDIDEEKLLQPTLDLSGQAVDFGGLLKLMLLKLAKQLNDPPFNFMVHPASFGLLADLLPCTHWFLQIVPQLSVIGGFEMGSGCCINLVFPEDAAKLLREVDCPQ